MKRLNLIKLLLIAYYFHPALATTTLPTVKDDDLLRSSLEEIREVGRVVLRLSTSLEEVKSELRKEIQETKLELKRKTEEINSSLHAFSSGLNVRLISGLSAIEASMKLKLQELDEKIEACNSMINSVSQTAENTWGKTASSNAVLSSINSTMNRNQEELKSGLETIQAKMAHNGIGIERIFNLLVVPRSSGTVQLNETRNSMRVLENKTAFSVSKFSPLLNHANLTQALDVCESLPLSSDEWIVIQTRGVPLKPGRTRELFQNRTWTEYRNGFGSHDADFWFGLDKIHVLTNKGGFTELRIELEDWEGDKRYAEYGVFKVAGLEDNYRLSVDGYSGTAGDAMAYSNRMQFSTADRDNDLSFTNCALSRGPWWLHFCTGTGIVHWNVTLVHAQLNFDYQNGSKVNYQNGIIWYHWKGWGYSLKKVEMKIRRPPNN